MSHLLCRPLHLELGMGSLRGVSAATLILGAVRTLEDGVTVEEEEEEEALDSQWRITKHYFLEYDFRNGSGKGDQMITKKKNG